ncbi:site-specific tyrosine recombinase XerD [Mesonia aquimarina]|uniref:site-specific tyrosine recombinase XerD n=1 Tax=Mesonia aquimarina TaxID=1504967 RepID=UPI000EF5A406|nr:site-specific tyrosine recombinase XerD [Mesonia aquimarina]
MKWNQLLKDYQHYLRIERGLSSNSIENYSYDIHKLINYLKAHQIKESPADIQESTIQQFIYSIAKSSSSVRTQARIIAGLRGFFSYLIFENYRENNPLDLIEAPKIGRKLPDTLSTQEIDELIKNIDLSKPEGERNKAIIETLYSCGLRVTELVNLKISDLFFEEGFIKVSGKGNKERFVPISNYTTKLIETYRNKIRVHISIKKQFEDTLFLNRRGGKLSRAMIFTIVKRLAEEAQLNKKISPHTFRHSFASHLLENGADLRSIQQMLGHESITTTEIYMHTDRSQLKKAIQKFHPRS